MTALRRWTKEEALQKHIAMWTWLCQNPTKHKSDYSEWMNTYPRPGCFLCEIVSTCEQCLLAKAQGGIPCHDSNSWYRLWVQAGEDKDWEKRREYAKLIRDIFKGDV